VGTTIEGKLGRSQNFEIKEEKGKEDHWEDFLSESPPGKGEVLPARQHKETKEG